jgi:hypothetical protein
MLREGKLLCAGSSLHRARYRDNAAREADVHGREAAIGSTMRLPQRGTARVGRNGPANPGPHDPEVLMTSRRILANLLCEDELARAFSGRNRRSTPSRTVLATASQMGTLLRVFAREGDRLWTPGPVNLVPEIPGLPAVILESGPLRDLPVADEVLGWCETPEVASCRRLSREPAADLRAPLHQVVWRLPVPSPAVVAAVHHRAFCLQLAEELGYALPGARMVESLAELDRILGRRRAPPRWVLKAPLSAAGRDRYIERDGPALIELKARRTVERLFERHGPLLFEPWMDRLADFGVSALLAATELRIVGVYGQRVDAKGQFLGIDLDPAISAADRERLLETTEAVATVLRRAGYVGPFGIDAWTYRDEDGSIALHPLGEINARMTFGLVAWTWAERAQTANARLPLSGLQEAFSSSSRAQR